MLGDNDKADLIHINITYTSAEVISYIVASLFALLSIFLIARILHKFIVQKAACKLASVLLVGFAAYCTTRSATMFLATVDKVWTDPKVVLPTALYSVMLLLMLALWDSYLMKMERTQGRERSLIAKIAIPVIGLITTVLTVLVIWSMSARPFNHAGKVVYSLDAMLCFMSGTAFTGVGMALRRLINELEVSAPGLIGITSSGAYAGGAVQDGDYFDVDDYNKKNSCCLVHWVTSPVHIRAQAAAIVLGVYTVVRGVAPLLNVFFHSDAYMNSQQWIIPCFYLVEWLFLSMSVSLIVGPPSTSSSSESGLTREGSQRFLSGNSGRY